MKPMSQPEEAEPTTTSRTERTGIAGDVEAALRYPLGSDDVVLTVGIGGLLSLLGFLIVPLVLLAGYVVRVLDRAMAGDDRPPAFDDWAEMAATGLAAAVVGVAYALIPTVVGGGVVLIGTLGLAGPGQGVLAGLGVLGVVLGGLLWLGLSLVAGYLAPAALANFAQRRRLAAGFDLGVLVPVWRSRAYAVAWLAALVVLLGGGVVAAALNAVPLLGTIAGAFVGFYAAVAAYAAIGRAWPDTPAGRARDGAVDAEAARI